MFHAPNQYRYRESIFATTDEDGNNGYFTVTLNGEDFVVVCSDGMGWEHVSVSNRHRTPTWDEMCKIKALFWDPEDTVVQFHPPESQYVNMHQHCLHLWRPISKDIPTPPSILVGVK